MNRLSLLLLLILTSLSFSCDDDDSALPIPTNKELAGTWQLIEVFLDPGDLSGSYQPVNSDRMVIFLADGSLSSNGDLCNFDTSTDQPTTGFYSLTEERLTVDCNPDRPYRFRQDGSTLVIDFSCFEGCSHKYRKLID